MLRLLAIVAIVAGLVFAASAQDARQINLTNVEVEVEVDGEGLAGQVGRADRQMTRDGTLGTGDPVFVTRFCSSPQAVRILASRVAEDGGQETFDSVMRDEDIHCFRMGWPGHNFEEPFPAVMGKRVLEAQSPHDPPEGFVLEFWSLTIDPGLLTVDGEYLSRIYSWRFYRGGRSL